MTERNQKNSFGGWGGGEKGKGQEWFGSCAVKHLRPTLSCLPMKEVDLQVHESSADVAEQSCTWHVS